MPKLKPSTAILRVVDKHDYKDGNLFREIRDACISWGIPVSVLETTLQEMIDTGILEEPMVGYIKRVEKHK